MKRESKAKQALSSLKMPLFLLLSLCIFLSALFRVSDGQKEEGRLQLEESLRLSAMACYATEGIYPPTLDYLTERYGILIDEERYAVFYEIFADNLMPTITVVTLS